MPRLLIATSLVAAVSIACGTEAATSDVDAGPYGANDAGAQTTPDAGSQDRDRCTTVRASIEEAGFAEHVKVSCDDTYAWIESNTDPDHPKMNGITGTNDQVPVPAPGYRSPVALSPAMGDQPLSIDAALGVAVNGVPIYDYSSQGTNDLAHYDPKFDTKLTGELDQCNGHSGRGDDYHYHAEPTCMVAAMRNKGPGAILGWAFDGYPIYGRTAPDGAPITAGALDVCNGMTDAEFGYRYHTSDAHPYILQCLKGRFDLSKAPRVPPLDKQGGGGGRPPGQKPPGGVQNLKLIEDADGTHTMTYEYHGRSYSIAYKPSATSGCWDFTDASYTTGGATQRGTYCRRPW